ncbi:hypothetical protein WICMUC_002906 [Wickerhamomyces mucosus]|uniref:UTP23 sensor motif region domain-containing protein n=1 Tax=Wickerhamomyces mucosus TaxID=1378264 RepID=A0A9P8PPQ3_9ASCO|nr:hypothetical protein WICMUC_002906 [Wickerhamomyces mucosus]
MQELYSTKNQNAIEIAKTFERRRCNHPPTDPIPPHECIKSIVNIDGENKHRYVVATENERLRYSLRKIPGIPLVYMNRSVMVMESLSKASASISRNMERGKLTGGLNNAKSGIVGAMDKIKNDGENEKPTKKRKGPKEPNPLSIKKKKSKVEDNDEFKDEGQKKKRKRKSKTKTKEDDDVDNENSEKLVEDES